jgi:hypothetical protein
LFPGRLVATKNISELRWERLWTNPVKMRSSTISFTTRRKVCDLSETKRREGRGKAGRQGGGKVFSPQR